MMSTAFPVLELDEIDSTNQEALRRAAAGEVGPLWIRANRQWAGRGRSGRAWSGADGNLTATLLFSPDCPLSVLHQLSFVSGVAAYDAIEPYCAAATKRGAPPLLKPDGPPLRLKWPNDVLAGPAKLGGILIESTTNSAGAIVAAIGIGINIARAPEIEGRVIAALGDWWACPGPQVVLEAIDIQLRKWLALWCGGDGFGAVREAWLARAHGIGTALVVHTGAETICGTFAGIDETGALLLSSVGSNPNDIRRFTYGDVSLPAPRAI